MGSNLFLDLPRMLRGGVANSSGFLP